jgi:hypothetical protein
MVIRDIAVSSGQEGAERCAGKADDETAMRSLVSPARKSAGRKQVHGFDHGSDD